MTHVLISLLHCLFIAFNGKEKKCPYSAMLGFQDSCKLYVLESLLRVKGISSQAVGGIISGLF